MKKVRFFLFVTCCVLLLTSCGGRKKTPIPTDVEQEVDSLVYEMTSLFFMPFYIKIRTSGVIPPEDESAKVTYLLPPSKVGELRTVLQRNYGLMMYMADFGVAQLYEMPESKEYREVINELYKHAPIKDTLERVKMYRELRMPEGNYDEAIANLTIDLRLQEFMHNTYKVDLFDTAVIKRVARGYHKQYDAEKQKGTDDLFIGRFMALFSENIYLLSQNPDFYFTLLNANASDDLVYRLGIVISINEKMMPYNTEMARMSKTFATLKPLLEVTSNREMQERLKTFRPLIAAHRNAFLNNN